MSVAPSNLIEEIEKLPNDSAAFSGVPAGWTLHKSNSKTPTPKVTRPSADWELRAPNGVWWTLGAFGWNGCTWYAQGPHLREELYHRSLKRWAEEEDLFAAIADTRRELILKLVHHWRRRYSARVG